MKTVIIIIAGMFSVAIILAVVQYIGRKSFNIQVEQTAKNSNNPGLKKVDDDFIYKIKTTDNGHIDVYILEYDSSKYIIVSQTSTGISIIKK